MFQILAGYVVGTALVAAITFASAIPASAAGRNRATATSPRYYDYAPGYPSSQLGPSQLTPGQLGQLTNPALPNPGPFGPPDPASCGGFHC